MLLAITVMLVTLAALNAVLTAWATMLDAGHASALMRALGAKLSPGQRSQYGHCAGWVGPSATCQLRKHPALASAEDRSRDQSVIAGASGGPGSVGPGRMG
jgi:hypothetical protein